MSEQKLYKNLVDGKSCQGGDMAWNAAEYAAEYAARNAAKNATKNAATHAVLQCVMTTICADLEISEPHSQVASDFWSIWKAGFGCAGKVGDEYYIYERP